MNDPFDCANPALSSEASARRNRVRSTLTSAIYLGELYDQTIIGKPHLAQNIRCPDFAYHWAYSDKRRKIFVWRLENLLRPQAFKEQNERGLMPRTTSERPYNDRQ